MQLPYVPTAQELLDKAFRRARKAQSSVTLKNAPLETLARVREITRLNTIQHVVDSTLSQVVKGFPSMEKLHPFYFELINLLVGVDKLKHSLGAVDWARKTIIRLVKEYTRKLKKLKKTGEMEKARKEAYGRIASVLKKVKEDLDFLKESAKKLSKLPDVDPEAPTIVVAGYANVGKSSFVRRVSTAEPKIAPYPFTTREIVIGHWEDQDVGVKVQIIDTPGLLDRPLSKRNKVELQAILALKHLADVIVFILDPSETCSYPFDKQLNLLYEIERMFLDTPILTVINKIDVCPPDKLEKSILKLGEREVLKMSALTGEGVKEVFNKALEILREAGRLSLAES